MLVIQGGRGSVLEGRNNEADARDVKQDRRGVCLKKKTRVIENQASLAVHSSKKEEKDGLAKKGLAVNAFLSANNKKEGEDRCHW